MGWKLAIHHTALVFDAINAICGLVMAVMVVVVLMVVVVVVGVGVVVAGVAVIPLAKQIC
jgi:hypothetical protein